MTVTVTGQLAAPENRHAELFQPTPSLFECTFPAPGARPQASEPHLPVLTDTRGLLLSALHAWVLTKGGASFTGLGLAHR